MGSRTMHMRTLRYMLLRSAITLVISGCFEGAGSGLIGITGGGGGGGSGAPPVLGFFVQPGTADEGQTMAPVEVVATDSLGTTDSTFTGAITISLTSNSTGAALSGTATQRASAGVATFNNLSVDKAGTYRLQATTSGASAVTSNQFTITTATGP